MGFLLAGTFTQNCFCILPIISLFIEKESSVASRRVVLSKIPLLNTVKVSEQICHRQIVTGLHQ